jgi:hypothetical protein
VFDIGRNPDGLSRLQTTEFAVNLVAKGAREHVEGFGLVVVVVVRWSRGRLGSVALSNGQGDS